MARHFLSTMMLVVALTLSACQPQQDTGDPPETSLPVTLTPQYTQAPEERFSSVNLINQWGVSAEASSEFANPEWSAAQASGSPDSPGCGDYQFAWASAASDGIETLSVSYEIPVYPLQINIHESFNPDQVVKVEVFNSDTGSYFTVLQKNPLQIDRPCPYQLRVLVEGIDFKTSQVRITVDQSQLGLGWNEIDAVELVGSINPPQDQN